MEIVTRNPRVSRQGEYRGYFVKRSRNVGPQRKTARLSDLRPEVTTCKCRVPTFVDDGRSNCAHHISMEYFGPYKEDINLEQQIQDFDWAVLGTTLREQTQPQEGERTRFLDPRVQGASLAYHLHSATHLFAMPRCRCRDILAAFLSLLNTATRKENTGEIFTVSQKTLLAFQDVVDCLSCEVQISDLVCIAGVFESVGAAFEILEAAADLGSTRPENEDYNWGFNDPVRDPKLRGILITTLVYQAIIVVKSISEKGVELQHLQSTPWPVSVEVNFEYLKETIWNSNLALRNIADSADDGNSLPKEGGTPTHYLRYPIGSRDPDSLFGGIDSE